MNHTDDFLITLLAPERLSSIVDIGANPIDGDPPYKKMLENELCQVIGFEPQQDALNTLLQSKSTLESYFPYAIGDGGQHTLHRCRASGMTSLYKPDQKYLSTFNDFDILGEVISTEQVPTKRLDDIPEITHLDMLKIDVQGAELAIFESGRKKLAAAVAVQTEVSFIPLYEGQPLYWEIDRELRQQGFIPHTFTAIKRWPLSPYAHPANKRQPVNQLLEADAVYVRDFVEAETMSDEQVKQLALIAHHCYESHDLVSRCLSILITRGAVSEDALQAYHKHIFPDLNLKGDVSPINYSVSFNL